MAVFNPPGATGYVGRSRDKVAALDCAICVRTEMPTRTSCQQRPLQPRNPTLVCRHLRHALAIDTVPAQPGERLSHRREHLKQRHTCSAFRSSYSVSDAQRPRSTAGRSLVRWSAQLEGQGASISVRSIDCFINHFENPVPKPENNGSQ